MGIGALLGGRDESRKGGEDAPSTSMMSSLGKREREWMGGRGGERNKEQDASGKGDTLQPALNSRACGGAVSV